MKAFDRIIGYADIKKQLERTADVLRNLDTYKAAGAKTPSGMLIHGAPGVGKSLMAECVIEAAGVPTFTVRKDKTDGAFVYHVKQIFEEAAKAAPSIVYLDDMDKFANADAEHKNAEEYVAVQSAIDSVKGKDVFVLATTNDLQCLPNSLTRPGRFDRQIFVQFPDGEEAELIIKHYLSDKQLADDICWDDVAMLMQGCSCAGLESTLNEALLVSISRQEDVVSRAGFMEAYFETRVRRPLGMPTEVTDMSPEERRQVATHEAGHVAIYEIFANRSISLATAFRKSDRRGGLCNCYKPADCSSSLWGQLRVLGALGGRAATDLVYGIADEGSGDDLDRVANYIRSRIDAGVEFGMPTVHPGRQLESNSKRWREEALLEAEIARLYQKAKEVLAANREFLDKLADAITKNEYLISSDIQAIKETCTIVEVAI